VFFVGGRVHGAEQRGDRVKQRPMSLKRDFQEMFDLQYLTINLGEKIGGRVHGAEQRGDRVKQRLISLKRDLSKDG